MRIGCDTGGTFTDLVTITDRGRRIHKAPTTPTRPVEGILNVLELAATDDGISLRDFLAQASLFVHGTTHPLNAVVTGRTARTALVVTRGHRDILSLREGGRTDPFDKTVPFPRPFVPRHLTFEVDERILYDGTVDRSLAADSLDALTASLSAAKVEAVAVCLLWSIRNPTHEQAIRAHLARAFPDLPISLSSEVNPIIREFRRASSTAIDAALKPLVGSYVNGLEHALREAGLTCPFFLVASDGALLEPGQAAARPVSLINSGPSMAPGGAQSAARALGDQGLTGLARDMVVCDAGGTTFDVSIIANGTIKTSTENWIGDPADRLFCGFPSIEVLSIGAGGGSIAGVDPHGLMYVGPQSAGAVPGPACYGAGGVEPTFTDAALLSGIINPKGLLGGRLQVDLAAARTAVETRVARPLGLTVDQALLRISALTTDRMVHAIEEAVQKHGLSPFDCTLVGAGGAAGFNIIDIAERLGSHYVYVPGAAPVLSAFGMAVTHPFAEKRAVLPTRASDFDMAEIARLLAGLREQAIGALPELFREAGVFGVSGMVEARYEGQVWEIEIAFNPDSLDADLPAALRQGFDRRHQELFHHSDPSLDVEFITWRVGVAPGLKGEQSSPAPAGTSTAVSNSVRQVLHASGRRIDMPIHDVTGFAGILKGAGPAIVESDYTTLSIGKAHDFTIAGGDIVVRINPRAKE